MVQRSEADDRQAGAGPDQHPGAEAASLANALVSGTSATSLEQYVEQLAQPQNAANPEQAAHVLEALAQIKPELLTPHIELLVKQLESPNEVVARACAFCLPVLARVVPAKVAKQLKTMQAALPSAPEIARDGLVRTFVALCVASVTYQKRLIDSFELALRTAQPHQLTAWVEHVLPALKGEPYAQARSTVEQRLLEPQLPREIAQRIADFLGIKLRPLPDRK
jgi:hypothetical protein